MKSTGMVRKVDDLGRVVIPIEIRRSLNIRIKDALEIFVDGNRIVMQKVEKGCVFCGNMEDLATIHDRSICKECITLLSESNN